MNRKANHNQAPLSGELGDEMAADRYIDQIMQRDRDGLAQKHDRQGSKMRAAAFLAASTVPAQEAVGASVWLSKLASVKGMIGVIGTVAATGGVVLAISLSGSNSNQVQDSSPSDSPSSSITVQTFVDSLNNVPSALPEEFHAGEATDVQAVSEQSSSSGEVRSTTASGRTPLVKKSHVNAVVTDTTPVKTEQKQHDVVQPEVHQQESLRVNLKVDPVQINR